MVKKINLKLSIEQPFGNLFRKETVLILCKTHRNTFIMGEKKDFYPKGICRLLGGGVEKDRDNSLISAAQAELEEEIMYRPPVEALIEFGEVRVTATAKNNKTYKHTVHMFYTQIPQSVLLMANDDVTSLCELSVSELENLAKDYMVLSDELIATEGSLTYSWYDYGQVYGPIHAFAAEYARHTY